MKGRVPASALWCCAVISIGALAGCGGGSGTTSNAAPKGSPAAGAGQHRGGTLTVLSGTSNSAIDFAVSYDANWTALRLTNDGLMAWKRVAGRPGTELVPDLAQAAPKPTDGGRTYVFKLRDGITFSNGHVLEPSDVSASFERQFKLAGAGAGYFYGGIEGASACMKHAKSCRLSAGVVPDDAAGTVTFHLTAPDAEFLQKLAMPFGFIAPKGTPAKDTGTTPLPATGPYMIQRFDPSRELVLVRNPKFKQWSADAQPDGHVDRMVVKLGVSPDDAVTQVANGQADLMADPVPPGRLQEIASRFAKQLHVNALPQVTFMALNTHVAPFDDVRVRRALNFATDRSAIVKIVGGPRLARPSCQVLPADFPGYVPYCPYTANPGAQWSAPDLAQAKQLVDESGTKGTKVKVVSLADEPYKAVSLYFVSLLRKLGYPAELKTLSVAAWNAYVQDSRNKVQITPYFWTADYPAASNFLNIAVGCSGYHADSNASPNVSGFCDQAIQKKTEKALSLAQSDPDGANRIWAEVDHATTDQAPWVTLYVTNRLTFVASRVGNVQFNASILGGFMPEQAWVS